jgi:hypothetical protein
VDDSIYKTAQETVGMCDEDFHLLLNVNKQDDLIEEILSSVIDNLAGLNI